MNLLTVFITVYTLSLQLEHAACQTTINLFDIENEGKTLSQHNPSGKFSRSVYKYNPQDLLHPVIVERRPELIRSESENLEYSAKTRTHRYVSLSSLLNKAFEAGQISSKQSFTKLSDPINPTATKDAVIFIKTCCKNHEKTDSKMNTEEALINKCKIISESQSPSKLSTSNKEEHSSSPNIQSNLEILAQTELSLSHKKRQKTKRKSHASKQRKVGRHNRRQHID